MSGKTREKADIRQQVEAALAELGAEDISTEHRAVDGGGWITECTARVSGDDISLTVLYYDLVDEGAALILEGWHFDQVRATDLHGLITAPLSGGPSRIEPVRGLFRSGSHVLEATVNGRTYHASYDGFTPDRAEPWERRLMAE
jgi:hypothetical protein